MIVSDSSVCNKQLTKRDIICLLVGVVSVVVIGTLFILLAIILQPHPQSADPWTSVRLPTDMQPQSYVVKLEPDLSTLAVQGSVFMILYVNKSTQYIVFHAADMEIEDTLTVSSVDSSEELEIDQIFNYTEYDYYVVQMASELIEGETVNLSLSFSYKLRSDLAGFYNSSYTSSDGSTHVLAVTQFESTDARRAFPCFDEPAMKANFSIAITHDSQYVATSNMPVKLTSSTVKRSGKITTTFDTSVKMSTYLVAFVVSDFRCTDPLMVDSHIKVIG